MKSGYTHVYYGTGKGKTTAALGLALRASGQGLQVLLVQFLKQRFSGELVQLRKLPGITLYRGSASTGPVEQMTQAQKEKTLDIHNSNLLQAQALVAAGQCDLLILDEGLDACQLGLVDEQLFSDLVANKPPQLELVITGHQPIAWVLDLADYVTEMVKHKHPFDRGLKARSGIEF